MKRIILSLTAIAVVGVLSGRSTPEPVAAALAMPFVSDSDCILECWDSPPYCEGVEHDAWWVSSPTNEYGDGYHSIQHPCWPQTCAAQHPDCTGGSFAAGDLEELRLAIVAVDPARLRAAVAQLGAEAAQINTARSAVQLLGCSGNVIAHLPMSPSLTATFAD